MRSTRPLLGKTHCRPGVILLETIVVLHIMVVFLGAGLAMGYYLLRDNTASEQVTLIQELATATRMLKSHGGYPPSSELLPTLSEMEMLPDEFHITGSGASVKVTNSFGGEVRLHRIGSGGHFAIEFTNIPTGECRAMAYKAMSEYVQAVGDSISSLKSVRELEAEDVGQWCDEGTNTLFFASGVP